MNQQGIPGIGHDFPAIEHIELAPPEGTRFSSFPTFIRLEFPAGKKREMLDWLHGCLIEEEHALEASDKAKAEDDKAKEEAAKAHAAETAMAEETRAVFDRASGMHVAETIPDTSFHNDAAHTESK